MVVEALGSADHNARGEAACALGWIGGGDHTISDRIRPSIERALEIETDQRVVEQMKYALRTLC
jgi:HEAT repeat protein